MLSVKGSAVTARVRWVREHFGEPGYQRFAEALGETDRAALAGRILPHEWVPYDLFIHVNVAADKLFGKGDLQLCYELGKYSAETNLPTLYKLFYKFGTPMFIFRKAARLWDVHYNSGHITPIEEPGGVIKIRIEEYQRPHRAHCLSVLGWAAKSIELSGGKLHAAEESRCRTYGDPYCELKMRWSEK